MDKIIVKRKDDLEIILEKLDDEVIEKLIPFLKKSNDEVYCFNSIGDNSIIENSDNGTVNFNLYKTLQENDTIDVFTLHQNKKMIGYMICNIYNHPQNETFICGDCESVYIDIDKRNFKNFSFLLNTIEEYLTKRRKVKRITFGFPHYDDLKIKLFERKGYSKSEIIMTKEF